VNLGRVVWFLHQHVDKRLLFGGRRNGWYVWYSGWWRSGCLDEHDFVVFLRRWRRLYRLLRRVIRRLRWRYVHVHVLVYNRSLLRWPVLRYRPTTRIGSAVTVTPADGRCVAVQRQSRRESATAATAAETCQWRFGSAQATAHC